MSNRTEQATITKLLPLKPTLEQEANQDEQAVSDRINWLSFHRVWGPLLVKTQIIVEQNVSRSPHLNLRFRWGLRETSKKPRSSL